MAGLRSSRRVQIKQGDQRTRLPAVACRSSARSSGNFGARPAREAGGNAVGQVHPKRCEARELTGRSISSRVLAHGPELLRTRVARVLRNGHAFGMPEGGKRGGAYAYAPERHHVVFLL